MYVMPSTQFYRRFNRPGYDFGKAEQTCGWTGIETPLEVALWHCVVTLIVRLLRNSRVNYPFNGEV